MSPTGLQTAEETAQRAAAHSSETAESAEPPVASQRTRRLLRAVEQYKAAQLAHGEAPREDDAWLVLIAAVAAQGSAAGD